VPSSAPHIVQTSAPHIVPSSAPLHEKVYVSQTIHAPHTQATPTPTPTSVSAPSKNNYNIIIHQHINFVIQNFKYTQKHSYAHIENLLRHLKSITQNHHLYKNLLYTRRHLYNHYNTMFKELYRLLKEFDTNNHIPPDNTIDPFYPNDVNSDDNDDDNNPYEDDDNNPYEDDDNDDNQPHKIPPFINSMKILDRHIQQLEKSIHFIKGKYKYTLINILHKLKLQYRHDTIRLLHYWRNRFI
jgi:hypothetical protein